MGESSVAAARGRSSPWMGFQESLNRASAGLWAGYGTHRRHVMECLTAHAPDLPGRLTVLGAGNCNDLDLATVTALFREVHLVDIDAAALDGARRRQRMNSVSSLHAHGGVDVTSLDQARPPGLGPADVVMSAAILSQLIAGAVAEGRAPDGLLRVRDTHLETMLNLLRPGGRGLLINDLVSSDTYPQLRTTSHHELPQLLMNLIRLGNFFTGCNPWAIAQRLAQAPLHASRIAVSPPWRWDIGPRSYLVCAISFNHPQ
ncbi:hypothetical protein ABZX75_34390 [Streptomyces sp. NPDC003038]|uniref:hypothetical protein n=1 Tax=unclassified Streptomyces TaxID=2593676 RepID=UPI0033A0ABA1